MEELELLDNITSCNVVDNYLMLDEYEQNLIKEGETPGGGGGGGMRGRLRKWSLVRQPSVGGVQVGQVTFSVSWLNLKSPPHQKQFYPFPKIKAGRGVLPVSGAGLRGAFLHLASFFILSS